MKKSNLLWRTVPRKTLVISLIGVFFIGSTIGFANDIIDMGRRSSLRSILDVLLIGGFAVAFAVTGTILRKRWWKAFFPLFAVEIILLNLVGHWRVVTIHEKLMRFKVHRFVLVLPMRVR